jgi:hypothetical protein
MPETAPNVNGAKCSFATLILCCLELSDEYPVLALNRYVELLYRQSVSLALIWSLQGSKMLRLPAPDNLHAPAGHGSPPNCPSDHVENRYDDNGGSDGSECIEENAMSFS